MNLLYERVDLRRYHLVAYEYMVLLSKLVYGSLDHRDRLDLLAIDRLLGRTYPYPEF